MGDCGSNGRVGRLGTGVGVVELEGLGCSNYGLATWRLRAAVGLDLNGLRARETGNPTQDLRPCRRPI